jgi:hypothetical protein
LHLKPGVFHARRSSKNERNSPARAPALNCMCSQRNRSLKIQRNCELRSLQAIQYRRAPSLSSASLLLLRRILAPRGNQPKSVFSDFPSFQRADLQGQLRVEIPTFAKLRRMTETAGVASRRTGVRAKSASPANSGRVVKRRVLMTARLIVSPQDLKNSAKDKFPGPCRQRTVGHLVVKTAQILADERLGN